MADGPVGFGHRRLAIIDITEGGHQPMATPDGQVMVTFNGEIYNFQPLRRHLEERGHRFRSQSDTEVLLAAYCEYGVGCLAHLRGMFAFGVWDARKQLLFLARDRLGKKPLFYRLDADGIAFASETKAFLAEPSFSPRPDLEGISHYLSLQYVPSPWSAFEGVRKLPPAHYLVVCEGRIRVERYWRLNYRDKPHRTEEEACDELIARLEEAVRLRLISDVPLGAFLSGGIDSSVTVALMARLGSGPVKTFSIGFEEKEYDELPHGRLVASRFGTDHHEFLVRPDAASIFERLAWQYGEPFADESAIPTYYLSELTRRHVTVALNGDAGDENFAGYGRYVPAPWVARAERLPGTVRRAIGTLGSLLPSDGISHSWLARGRRRLAALAEPAERRYARGVMHFEPALKWALCTPEFLDSSRDADSMGWLLDRYLVSDAPDFLDRTLDVDVGTYLPDCLLVKVDIATMAHALEGRSPFLDHEVMEFAASLPSSFKLRDGTTKYLLKRAARGLLPAEILDRPKQGFGVPLDRWFRNELHEMAHDVLLSARFAQRGYFRMPLVQRMLDEHGRGVHQWHDQLFNLLMLELWQRQYVDRPSMHTLEREARGSCAS